MTLLLLKEIDNLKRMISSLSAHVEESVQKAVTSIVERDGRLAQSVIDADPTIDAMEVDLEEECLKILALHQPVAQDLRFVVAALKVNNDLERIGDLAANCAEQGVFLAGREAIDVPYDLRGMAEKVQAMLRDCLDAFMGMNAGLAARVRAADDEVDAMDRLMYPGVRAAIRTSPGEIESLIRLLRVSQNLERIADHATNIAEDVIYMVNGSIVRHRAGEGEERGSSRR